MLPNKTKFSRTFYPFTEGLFVTVGGKGLPMNVTLPVNTADVEWSDMHVSFNIRHDWVDYEQCLENKSIVESMFAKK
jgi:hypothetical protein